MISEVAIFCLRRLTDILIFSLLYGILFFTAGSDAEPPDGKYFVLLLIFAAAFVGGEICGSFNTPPLLGMLLAGFMVRNIAGLRVQSSSSSFLRNFALTTILLRAGVGLDPAVLKRLSVVCFRLAFTPCLMEALTSAITGYFILRLSLDWGFLLGFVLAAVSPAIVVKAMLNVQEKGFGVSKGIPTLVMAAASIDDVLAITGFGVMAGIVYSGAESQLWKELIRGPAEALLGLATGTAIGAFLWFFPFVLPDSPNNRDLERNLLTFLFGLFIVFGTRAAHLSGVGPLGSLTLTFVASLKWRSKRYDEPVDYALKTIWYFVEPFLFGLIGAEVDVKLLLSAWENVLLSLLTLTIGLIIRCMTVTTILWGANFTFKEKLFVALAWIPKATVQAALGPIALDTARERHDVNGITNGTLVLNIAALSIFLTAPLGAILIHFTAPKLLTKDEKPKDENPNEEKTAKTHL